MPLISKHKFTFKKPPSPYKKIDKRQSQITTLNKSLSIQTFRYGTAAFVPLKPLVLTSLFLIRFILFLKRITRKKDKTLRRFWITPKSFLKITKQSKGARMGKGKGKHFFLIQRIFSMSNFIEFKTIRTGRLHFFLRKLNARMPAPFFLNLPNLLKSRNMFVFLK